MPAEWTGDVVAKLHINQITQKELAEATGVSKTYLSSVLNGKRDSSTIQSRIESALGGLLAEKE